MEFETNLYKVKNQLENRDMPSLQEAKWQTIVCTYFIKLRQIIRHLSLFINDRLWNNSSSETVFESTKLEYQKALRKILLDKHFLKSKKLHKTFNRNTVKMSIFVWKMLAK